MNEALVLFIRKLKSFFIIMYLLQLLLKAISSRIIITK